MARWLLLMIFSQALTARYLGASANDGRDLIAHPPESLFRKRSDGRCGPQYDHASCDEDECCSSRGICGRGKEYCSGPACLLDYGPYCDANRRPPGTGTRDTPRPHKGDIPYGRALYKCYKRGAVALTYDDGPWDYTEDLLDILAQYDAKATFYVTGNNLGKGRINDRDHSWPRLLRRMWDEGHQIASHTWSHQRLTSISKDQVKTQMIYNEIAIADVVGYFPTYMRPPYSASNEDVDAWLGDLGYHITYFNLDTQGYLHDDPDAIQESRDIWDRAVEEKDSEDVRYLHIEHDPVKMTVYNLTAYMLRSMERKGLKTVTVGECLGDPKENWYRKP